MAALTNPPSNVRPSPRGRGDSGRGDGRSTGTGTRRRCLDSLRRRLGCVARPQQQRFQLGQACCEGRGALACAGSGNGRGPQEVGDTGRTCGVGNRVGPAADRRARTQLGRLACDSGNDRGDEFMFQE